jgi:hypothetical protein
MSYIHPAALAARRQYWTRHDAWRFAAPGTPEAKVPGWLDPSATRVRLQEAQDEEARAVFEAEVAQLRASHERVKQELAEVKYELAWRRMCRKYGYTPTKQLELKYPGQDRTENGRFTFGKMPKPESQPILARLPAPRPLRAPVVAPPPKGLETQLLFYNALSDGSTSERRAVLEFNARGFEPGAIAEKPAVHLGVLTRDQVSEACPRYWEVQSITNQAADLHSPGAYPTKQERGTAIHTWIRDEINGPRDPDFKAERSFIKSKEAGYGDKGSIRVDVYENRHNGTVCIYDVKTGDTGLSFARMRELASHVGTSYPGTTRIIVTEVRPYR